jgi:hypothetical protein
LKAVSAPRLRLAYERIVKRRAGWLDLESERGRGLVRCLRGRHERFDGETEIDVIGVVAQHRLEKGQGREIPVRRKRGEGSGEAAFSGHQRVPRRGKVGSALAVDRDFSARDGRRSGGDKLVVLPSGTDIDREDRARRQEASQVTVNVA